MARTLEIVPYSEEWPALYEKEKKVISKPLYNWVFEIQHIGSTAVPGLASKPTIDLLVGVADFDVVDVFCIEPMEALGYEYIQEYEDEIPERRFFQKLGKNKQHLFHVHMVQYNGTFWHRHLYFRNYLRKYPEVAKEYEELKKQLIAKSSNIQDYIKGKAPFIQKILSKMKK